MNNCSQLVNKRYTPVGFVNVILFAFPQYIHPTSISHRLQIDLSSTSRRPLTQHRPFVDPTLTSRSHQPRINMIHINLTLQRTRKNSLSRAGFEIASSGF